MDAKTLFKLFTQFNIVKDVFIPFKRRTVTNSRFGFVRFDCPVVADIAIQKANGLLVDERVLEVKKATNDRCNRVEQSRREPLTFRPPETNRTRDEVPFSGLRSVAKVLKGVRPTVAEKASLTIKANEDGLGWLYDSVIVRLNTEYSIINIENVLKEKDLDQNRGTLNNIGSIWSPVLSLDGDICQPKFFSYTRIKVGYIFLKHNGLEECSSNEICGSVMEGKTLEECFRKNEAESVIKVNTVVEESKWDGGFNREEEVCTKEADQRIGTSDCHLGEEVNIVVEETMLEESVHSSKFNVEQVFTPVFIRSFSGTRDGIGLSINLEVDLAQALSKNLNRKGLLSLNHSGLVRQPASVLKLLRNEKRKRNKKV
ncbi:hypothetical protein ACSBR1_023520 [Camellia fascicularis]